MKANVAIRFHGTVGSDFPEYVSTIPRCWFEFVAVCVVVHKVNENRVVNELNFAQVTVVTLFNRDFFTLNLAGDSWHQNYHGRGR